MDCSLPVCVTINGMVTSASVERACAEVSEFSDERMAAEFETFLKEQPAVCDFVMAVTDASRPEVREFSLFLSYMVFKAARVGNPGGELPVTQESIEASCQECERWIDEMNDSMNSESPMVPKVAVPDDEPYLVQYVISELNEPLEGDGNLDEDERSAVFFVLKAVIGSLSRKSYENKK